MDGIQNRRTRNLEKTFPGCLGRMVSLFDLSTSAAGNRLLADKPHRDGSPLSRGQSDAARMNPTGYPIEDKAEVSELRRSLSNKSSNGTPIKTLLAQEMSIEVESKHSSPSVVAKLMGLDALPCKQLVSAAKRSHSRSHSGFDALPRQQPELAAKKSHSRSLSGSALDYWKQEHCSDKHLHHEIRHCPEQVDNNDVIEIWQQSQEGCLVRDKPPYKGRQNENTPDKKMALVRQKFIEAKSLATNEKLRQSKQFQDALEVLSSNRDIFLKFLQEPNSMFSQKLQGFQSDPPPPETKRITVLRPSKMVNNSKFTGMGKKNGNQTKKASHVGEVIGWDKSDSGFLPPNWCVNNSPSQPTRIVVLKPTPGKPHDIKAVVSPPSSSPSVVHGGECYEESEDDEVRESREVAKEITQQIRENLKGHRSDETLLSSVFSNGYIGDESSFSKSENEYVVEGNLSDSELISPTSRHSWDYLNRIDSPCSSASFSRASYSPESSVCREAKKRLSERWALVASNGNCQEQRHVRRSSSTLGEMLDLSNDKNSVRPEEEGSSKEQEPRGSRSCLASDLNKDENSESHRNLLRSKSAPVSSTVFEGRLNVDPEGGKIDALKEPKELEKAWSAKSSLRGKVVSLFFSRSKKSSKEKSSASQSRDKFKKSASMSVLPSNKCSDNATQLANNSGIETDSLPTYEESSGKTSLPDVIGMGLKQGVISPETGFSVTKFAVPGNLCENQDQPSPISVLEPPFEEDEFTTTESSNINADKHGAKLSSKSNLIGKSPPIESIARTLSWDDSSVDTTSYPVATSLVSQGSEEEERDWLFLVQSLMSAAGLDSRLQSDSFFAMWHSPESPLDPSLRDKYIHHEAKRRQTRSTKKLVFDCVNAALVDITGYGLLSYGGARKRLLDNASPLLVDEVWARVKESLSCNVQLVSDDGGDINRLVVERVVRKEVVGKGWFEQGRLEIDNIGNEIEEQLLEDLVQEAVVELTGLEL